MGLPKKIYYYSHYFYVLVRYLVEYKYSIADNEDLNEVYENIYVGNISTAYNKEKLKEIGITDIVTVISGMPKIYPKDFNYKLVDALDIKKENLLKSFDDTTDFIDKALANGGKVYVHCMAGRSRSVSIVLAYLAKMKNIQPIEGLKMVKECRGIAEPNIGFQQQLETYYNMHNTIDKNPQTIIDNTFEYDYNGT